MCLISIVHSEEELAKTLSSNIYMVILDTGELHSAVRKVHEIIEGDEVRPPALLSIVSDGQEANKDLSNVHFVRKPVNLDEFFDLMTELMNGKRI